MENKWKIKKLSEVCEIINGGTPQTSVPEYWNGKHLWITPAEMGKRYSPFVNETERKLSDLGLKDSSAQLLPPYSVILSSRAPIGHLVINTVPMATNQGCKGLVPRNDLDSKYLYYYLGSIVDLLNAMGTGATFKEISGGKLKEVQIPVPSFGEQKQVVKILDEVFEKTTKAKENAEKNLQSSRELFESYLQNIFSNPGDDWEEKRLGDAYDVRDGTHDSPKYQKEGYPLVTSKNLKDDLLTLEDIQFISEKDYQKINERSKVDKGDILFAMIGTIGNPVVIEMEPNFAIKNVALFKVPKNQSSYFLKYFLDSKMVIDKMMHDAKGTTQKFVGLGYLRDFKILLPSFTKQQNIVAKLNVISGEMKKLEAIYQQKLTDLEELKKSVLHKAFKGKLAGRTHERN